MTSKTIYVMEGIYRNKRIENTTFKLVKGYQPYPHKEGGFVTVHIDDMAKYQAPTDKIRISVESESMLRDKAPEERAPESDEEVIAFIPFICLYLTPINIIQISAAF